MLEGCVGSGQEFFMRRILALCVLLAIALAAHGQSLGDVARQTRQKEKARTKAAKKVVTNEDIPESPALSPVQHETGGNPESGTLSTAPHSALEWRSTILAQKDRIETLQAHIDKLNASVHFVTANAYVNGVEYNQYQVRKQQEVKNLQKQLEEEGKKLADMQEAARKEGMGAAVYDP
jgi:predicted RNase H-like nuclease (RuvC/YqgF family)